MSGACGKEEGCRETERERERDTQSFDTDSGQRGQVDRRATRSNCLTGTASSFLSNPTPKVRSTHRSCTRSTYFILFLVHARVLRGARATPDALRLRSYAPLRSVRVHSPGARCSLLVNLGSASVSGPDPRFTRCFLEALKHTHAKWKWILNGMKLVRVFTSAACAVTKSGETGGETRSAIFRLHVWTRSRSG